MQSHIDLFKENIRGSDAPHFLWCGPQGGARRIILDSNSFAAMNNKEPFSRLFYSRNTLPSAAMTSSTSPPQDYNTISVPLLSTIAKQPESHNQRPSKVWTVNNETICLWHLLGQLNILNPKNKKPYSCNRGGCTVTAHREAKQVQLAQVIQMVVDRKSWNEEFKIYLTNELRAHSTSFQRV